MQILVTNDDGIYAEGLDLLVTELKKIARIMVVAPDRERSATGHSLTFFDPVRLTLVESKKGNKVYACSGTPSDCVLIGVLDLMDPRPDLVIAGINHGGNLGDDITYSGTVSAAIEGLIQGIPSFAISIVGGEAEMHYDYAAFFACKLARAIMRYGMPENTLLNVNVPNLETKDIKGWMFTCQGRTTYDQRIVKRMDPRGVEYYWIAGATPHGEPDEGTDFYAIKNGYISITPLHLDLTNFKAIDNLKGWKII
ncbi:MAG: 5'/3'-nucleotidase SurE [Candidatus Eremiobacteraeota bacterium]|nr:5'/3'-nucleotidase SurE [Candidatus Eremiobacteraeota bacterium]